MDRVSGNNSTHDDEDDHLSTRHYHGLSLFLVGSVRACIFSTLAGGHDATIYPVGQEMDLVQPILLLN